MSLALGVRSSHAFRSEKHRSPRARGADPDGVSVRYDKESATTRIGDERRFAAGSHDADRLLVIGMSSATLRAWPARSAHRGRGAVAATRARLRHPERRLLGVLTLGVLTALALAAALVWVRLQVVRTGYEISAARRLERRLEEEQRGLAIELATLRSPRRLEHVARARFGLRPPVSGQVVSVP